ncbi:MAG: hypothetical protein CW338_08835, partial [Clostridiales bacterium]|nr:hypothetical protein [Clostridiales bacterium]
MGNVHRYKYLLTAFIAALLLASLLMPSFAAPALADAGRTVRAGYFPEPGMLNGAAEGETKSGYAYEYMQEVAIRAGWRYEYVYGTFSELYPMLLRGEIDMLPYITKNDERALQMLFPELPMGDEQFYIASLTAQPLSEDLHEMEGARVGTTRGAFQNIPFRALTEEKGVACELVELDSPEARWAALEDGTIDYCIETGILFQQVALYPVYEFGGRYPYYLAVSPGREDLLAELNTAQEDIRRDTPGYLEELNLRYFNNIPLFRQIPEQGQAWLAGRDVIRIGTYDNDAPYVIEGADGKISGILPAQVQLMLDALGVTVPVEWKLYPGKKEAVAALYAGEIDCVNPYYRNYSDAEDDGLIISRTVYESAFSVLYTGSYTENTLSVIATPDTRLGASYVRDNYPGAVIVPCQNGYECMDRLEAGEATCVVMYTDALQFIAQQYSSRFRSKALEARCSVCFAALPENAGLIAVLNKGSAFVTDAEMASLQNLYSIEESSFDLAYFLRTHPECLWGSVAALCLLALATVLIIVRANRRAEKRRRQADFFRNIITRFTAGYEFVLHGSLRDGSYRVISGRSEVGGVFDEQGPINAAVDRYVQEQIHPRDREKVSAERLPFNNIRELLPVGKTNSIEYRSRSGSGYAWYRATMNRIGEDEILIGFRNCDDEIASRIVNDKLIDGYDALYLADLNGCRLRPVRSSRVSEAGAFTQTAEYTSAILRFAGTVAPRYTADWRSFSDPAYMKQYMKDADHREYVYELPGAARSMRRFAVDVLERVDGEPVICLFSFAGIDDDRARAIAEQRQAARQKVLLDYFISSYTSAFFVDLAENTFEVVHIDSSLEKVFGGQGNAREGMARFIAEYVHPDDRDIILQAIDKDSVTERLKRETSFSFTIREILAGEERTLRGVILRVSDEEHIAVGFMDITEEVRREREQHALSDGLAREYHTVWLLESTGDHRMHLYRSTGVKTIRSALQMGLDDPSYDTVIGKYIEQYVHEDDRERVREQTKFETVERETPETGTYTVTYRRWNDGHTAFDYHQMCFARAVSADGTVNYVLAYRDADRMIREQIASREELERRTAISNYFLKSYTNAYYADLKKREVLVIHASQGIMKPLVGQVLPLDDTVARFLPNAHPDDRELFASSMDPDYIRRQLRENGEIRFMYRSISKTVPGTYRCTIIPGNDEDHAAVGFENITEEMRRTREQQDILQSALDAANEEKRRTDTLHEIIHSSKWSCLVNARDEIIRTQEPDEDGIIRNGEGADGFNWIENLHPDDRDAVREAFAAAIRDHSCKTPYDVNYRMMVSGGEYRWFHAAGRVIRNEDGDGEFFGVLIDITDQIEDQLEHQHQLEQALSMAQSASRAKTAFLNSMSHDIRTSMNAIIGFTNLARTHIGDRELLEDYLGKIGQSSGHLLNLINDVLDMSRIESGKMNLEEKPEDLQQIIGGLRDIVQAEIGAKGHTLTVDTSGVRHAGVYCDRLRLSQVLLNILSNAIKYTPQGGAITLRVTEKRVKLAGYAAYDFAVSDNGMGMDQEYLKTIFDPFSRVRSTTVSGIQGTGLGMAITKSIVDMMGGAIDVQSEPGNGTAVTVTLDLRLFAGDAPAAAGSGTDRDFTGKKILLVEDNELNREIATEILEEEGFIIDTAEDGTVAVEK